MTNLIKAIVFPKFIRKKIRKICDSYFNELIEIKKEDIDNLNLQLQFLRERIQQIESNTGNINFLQERIQQIESNTGNISYEKIMRILTAFNLHQKTFSQFKNVNRGKNVVLVGAGPSVNQFQPIKDAVYVSVNRAFKLEKISFDYLFAIDYDGIRDYAEDFFSYRDGDCIKFVGDQNYGQGKQIPDSIINGKKVYRYMTIAGCLNDRITRNIDTEMLGNSTTTSIQAMQFILFTNPKRVYLVGIDCSGYNHFIGKSMVSSNEGEDFAFSHSYAIECWKKIKSFAQMYYPQTEIISVNPVRLKGVFDDWDQKEGDEPK